MVRCTIVFAFVLTSASACSTSDRGEAVPARGVDIGKASDIAGRTSNIPVQTSSRSVSGGTKDGFQRERRADEASKDALEGRLPPEMKVTDWVNSGGKESTLQALRGKVVVLDFWGVWCGPCRAAMPHLKELYARHKDDGLEVIGIHTTNQGEKMAEFVDVEKLPWPVAVDVDGATVAAFHVDSFPDYYLIDRAGILRVADLANAELDRAVEVLLNE